MIELGLMLTVEAMGHREAFIGTRAAFLDTQREVYAAAVIGNHIADCVADIQRRYFKRYPIDLDHDVEPSAESLIAVDDNAAEPEPISPDADAMTLEEYDTAVKAFEARQKLIKYRKEVSVVVLSCLDLFSRFQLSSKLNVEWRICTASAKARARRPARRHPVTTPWLF